MIEIHRLGSVDGAVMRELNTVFGRAFSEPETYLSDPPSDAYLSTCLENRNNIALVAKQAGKVVGGLVAYVLAKFERQRSEIYIYDLAVAEEHRRKGIATALIRRIQAIAKEIGAWTVYVQADYGDDAAIALYEKLGVREEVLHFDFAAPSIVSAASG